MPDLANCSLAQQNFLKKQTRLRNRVRLARLLIFLGFLDRRKNVIQSVRSFIFAQEDVERVVLAPF